MAITPESRVEQVLVLPVHSPKRKNVVEGLGLRTVGDLLRHFPRRYVDTSKPSSLDGAQDGELVTLIGDVVRSVEKPYQDRRTGRTAYRVETTLRTEDDQLKMVFFAKSKHISSYFASTYAPGARGLFFGKLSRFGQSWQLTNPSAALIGEASGAAAEAAPGTDAEAIEHLIGGLFPIYPLSGKVQSFELKRSVEHALSLVEGVPEIVPPSVRREHDLVDVMTALHEIHGPDSYAQVTRAQRYFRFEEALVTQVVLARRRRAQRALGAQARDGGDGALLRAFDASLPFELTAGQRRVGAEIEADLAQPHPMNRLLQGEVGSGKTLVALRAMLRVVDSGGQAVLLAPTEVLAQQHHRSISAMLGDLAGGGMFGGTTVELLTGSMTKTQRTPVMSRMASGEAGLVIGTHALLEERVQLADLGLVVVDEQHRFGVEQRAALTDKAAAPPHVLVMTATPIPRTVAMTVFGDLETSVLDELPAGRAPIQTTVVDLTAHPAWISRVWQRVREEVEAGHQVYVVCPRISGDRPEQGETDQLDLDEEGVVVASDPARPALAAVEEVVGALAEGPLSGLRVAPLHGAMPPDEKEHTMRSFADGEVDVLVATTVIEVGVDVHNATTMVILDADRFGVSQLHQLRGRVGRGGLPGLCLLVSNADVGSPAHGRLEAVAATTDGFELSRVDLEQRREGDVLGRSQSGWRSTLQTLRVLRDEKTIVAARETAESLLDGDPDLAGCPDLARAVSDLEVQAAAGFMEKA